MSAHQPPLLAATRRVALTIALSICAVLIGCATEKHPEAQRGVDAYYAADYAGAQRALRHFAEKTDEDYVLNNVRLGSAALADYDLSEAESAFYRAYEVINTGGVNDAGRSAAAIALAEKLKIWKGEPFERAMANFYLGVVYYIRQDYANARAAFENALFKLRDYGEGKDKADEYKEVESNFTIAYIMLGKCWLKLGNEEKAADIFHRAAQLRPELRSLADQSLKEKSNVLLIVDFGLGPRKVIEYDNSIVGFVPTPRTAGRIARPAVKVDGEAVSLRDINSPPIDLLELAQDRRWQSIDTIRLVKSFAGTGLMAAGAYEGTKRKPNYGTAAGLFAAGALLKASSTGDVRHWEMLPRCTFIIPLNLPPGKHNIAVSFPGQGGLSQTWRGMVAPEKGETTYYLRMTRMSAGPHDWPPRSVQ
jgi:tetratricopeptide (TPR) repeat protein